MLLFFAIAHAEPPPECATTLVATEVHVLDAWTGTLDGQAPEDVDAGRHLDASDTSVAVDESWEGRVEPELRSNTTRGVRRLLGPPSENEGERLGWEAPYGCLVLRVEAGAIAEVAVHHLPCPAAMHSAPPAPSTPEASSASE
ncbi:MAG: hypothetical protein EP330_24460 [Deltaproteobacteria bacterium]|nr:MAG: hypothetical protein EP330_24460 [Deltaproteobacteria bacterium]